jgi:heme-degrading monooxygenase HmoA
MEGFRGVLALADRSTGKMVAITFWESEEAMRASEASANKLRESAAGASAAEIASVDRFEVVLDTRT